MNKLLEPVKLPEGIAKRAPREAVKRLLTKKDPMSLFLRRPAQQLLPAVAAQPQKP